MQGDGKRCFAVVLGDGGHGGGGLTGAVVAVFGVGLEVDWFCD